jgi:hypothetical protein
MTDMVHRQPPVATSHVEGATVIRHGDWVEVIPIPDLSPLMNSWLPWQGTMYSTVAPAIVPRTFFAPSDEIHVKELLLSNGGGCYGKRGKRGK